jgi:hypothetical protein
MVSSARHLDAPLDGLGLNPPTGSISKGRGRKHFLSKSQSRVAMDVVVGKQLSNTTTLGELATPEAASK